MPTGACARECPECSGLAQDRPGQLPTSTCQLCARMAQDLMTCSLAQALFRSSGRSASPTGKEGFGPTHGAQDPSEHPDD